VSARIALLAAALVAAVGVSNAAAQSSGDDAGRFELAVGPLWIGQQPLGAVSANETTGGGGSFALFNTTTTLESGAGLEARFGARVAPWLDVELSGSYARPEIQTTVSGDFEGAAPGPIAECIQQYTVIGDVVWYPLSLATSRVRPFVTGGGGYLRQLHESETLAVTGQFYEIGGGVKITLASRPDAGIKTVGVRVDASAIVRVKGVAFDDQSHAAPAVGASVYVRF
jgi:hypothetical protein